MKSDFSSYTKGIADRIIRIFNLTWKKEDIADN